MNKVTLIGRLTKDPELRYTSSNIAVASFTLAVDRGYTSQNGERQADFLNIVVWRKPAENVKKFLTKGSQVAVDGSIQTRSYDDQNGQKRYITEILANSVEFLGSKGNTSSQQGTEKSAPTPYDFGNEPEPKGTNIDSNPFAEFGSSIELEDSDDLPF
jgi:single-stranded DNA-binding protein 2